METKEYSIYNKTRESAVSAGVAVINSTKEPLTALRVMIEGLGSENETGLWLTHVTSFPMVPRLSPFDLVYLDKNHCVVERFELLPAAEVPRFKSPAASALILPFQTVTSLRIDAGDEFFISENHVGDSSANEIPPAADVEPVAPAREVPALEIPAPQIPVTVSAPPPAHVALTICEALDPVVQLPLAQEQVAPPASYPQSSISMKQGGPKVLSNETALHLLSRSGKRKKRKNRRTLRQVAPVTAKPAASEKTTLLPIVPVAVETFQAAQTPVPSAAPAQPNDSTSLVAPIAVEAFATPEATAAPQAGLISESLVATEAPVVWEVTVAPAPFEAPFGRPSNLALHAREAVEEPVPSEASSARGTFALSELFAAQKAFDAAPVPERHTVPASEALAVVEAHELALSEAPTPTVAPASELRDAVPPAIVPFERRNAASAAANLPPALKPPAPLIAATEKTETSDEDRKPIVHRILRWLYPSLCKEDRRHAIRRPLDGLVAYDRSGEISHRHEIGNISSTGIYLLTEQRWEPGAMLLLTLQRSGPLERSTERRVDLEAGAVRFGKDGVGLSFLWPEGMDLHLWETPVRTGVYEAEPDYIVREMRTARALAFLRRICPAVTEHAKILFYAQLSNVRVANAVEIALKAEKLLVNEPNADKMLAHPDLILRILEDGSWVDVDWIQRQWAGLLATSCTVEGQDESNLVFINLLSLFAPIHARVLSAACAKAMSVMARAEVASSPYLVASSAEEMSRLMGSTNLTKVHRSIAELSDLGLLEKSTKTSLHSVSNITRTKPTHLGLQMYARCNGERGAA
jgi:hypothetical protein